MWRKTLMADCLPVMPRHSTGAFILSSEAGRLGATRAQLWKQSQTAAVKMMVHAGGEAEDAKSALSKQMANVNSRKAADDKYAEYNAALAQHNSPYYTALVRMTEAEAALADLADQAVAGDIEDEGEAMTAAELAVSAARVHVEAAAKSSLLVGAPVPLPNGDLLPPPSAADFLKD